MIRKLLTIGLPLLAPFVVYFIWWWTKRRRELAEARGREVAPWEDLPWVWLISAGAGLAALALIGTALTSGGDPFAEYQTPRFEDGKIIPGQVGR
jgi:cytochrome bd-type quinol oxidase subunit 2